MRYCGFGNGKSIISLTKISTHIVEPMKSMWTEFKTTMPSKSLGIKTNQSKCCSNELKTPWYISSVQTLALTCLEWLFMCLPTLILPVSSVRSIKISFDNQMHSDWPTLSHWTMALMEWCTFTVPWEKAPITYQHINLYQYCNRQLLCNSIQHSY